MIQGTQSAGGGRYIKEGETESMDGGWIIIMEEENGSDSLLQQTPQKSLEYKEQDLQLQHKNG